MQSHSLLKFSRLEVESRPPLIRIGLNHPPRNVIDLEMMDELLQVLSGFESRQEFTTIIFHGTNESFSAGVDIAAHTPDKIEDALERFHGMISHLARSSKITIAAVRGHCFGGGAELAMMCDLVFTSQQSTWQFPEIKLGCYPPVACVVLPYLVGPKQAAELIFTARSLTGAQAQAIGLATEVVADEEVETACQRAAEKIAELSPAALAMAKKAFYGWDSIQFEQALYRAERIYLDELMKTEDAREGISAWMEKRKPVWKGR